MNGYLPLGDSIIEIFSNPLYEKKISLPDAEDISPIPEDSVIAVVLKGDKVEDPDELLKL